ncbi:MAG: hypothetical protein GWQ05_07615 [Verrucomicrobiaceae bacterium]|nr:hypothetical protein [Verrucomicrobiaceae bacterium]
MFQHDTGILGLAEVIDVTGFRRGIVVSWICHDGANTGEYQSSIKKGDRSIE